MSHLRDEKHLGRPSRAMCRKGHHQYGDPQGIGAGIARQVCEVCSEVTIDLTVAHEESTPILRDKGTIGPLTSDV